MKYFKIAFFGVLCFAAVAASSIAGQPFGVTNYIAANTTITSWPTNTMGTNGLYQLTGGKVLLTSARRCMISIQGYPMNTNGTTITVALVRSSADGTPTVSATQNDWDTVTIPTFSFSITNSTSPFNFQTNLDEYTCGDANWLGIYSITTSAGGSAITNLNVSANTKIIPLRYP